MENRYEDVVFQLPRQGHECAPHCFEARCHRFRLIQEPHHSKEDFRNLHEGSVKLLKGLFGHNTSIFVRRYTHLRTQPNSETVCDYFGLVNLLHETADFSAVTLEQMGCFAQICELTATENDIRLLRKIEDDLQMSIEGLSAEIQRESNSSRSYSVNQLSQGNKQTRHFNLFSLWRSQELQLHH
ncbi:hypothetical protein RB195_024760 [Necator americanus]|uniref:Retrotransposon gag domain-containing protein n=1 Tax=Necator americanus TaxID=51031 RepID=A0ABR1EPG4_NECAM